MTSYILGSRQAGTFVPSAVVSDPYALSDLVAYCHVSQLLYEEPTNFYVCDPSDHPSVDRWTGDMLNACTNESWEALWNEEVY